MQLPVLSLLSAAVIHAGITSAAYVDLDTSANCGGTPSVTFNLQASHEQCFQRQSGEASLFISLDTFSCTVQLFTSTDGSCGGSVNGEISVGEDDNGCIDFTITEQDILIVCGST